MLVNKGRGIPRDFFKRVGKALRRIIFFLIWLKKKGNNSYSSYFSGFWLEAEVINEERLLLLIFAKKLIREDKGKNLSVMLPFWGGLIDVLSRYDLAGRGFFILNP